MRVASTVQHVSCCCKPGASVAKGSSWPESLYNPLITEHGLQWAHLMSADGFILDSADKQL